MAAQLHLSWFLTESDGWTSTGPSKFPECEVSRYLPFHLLNRKLRRKWCASNLWMIESSKFWIQQHSVCQQNSQYFWSQINAKLCLLLRLIDSTEQNYFGGLLKQSSKITISTKKPTTIKSAFSFNADFCFMTDKFHRSIYSLPYQLLRALLVCYYKLTSILTRVLLLLLQFCFQISL